VLAILLRFVGRALLLGVVRRLLTVLWLVALALAARLTVGVARLIAAASARCGVAENGRTATTVVAHYVRHGFSGGPLDHGDRACQHHKHRHETQHDSAHSVTRNRRAPKRT